MGCDWRTVRKYVDMEDFSCPPPTPASVEVHESKLDPFKPLIDEWLRADKLAPRKQRHTAKRVFKRLKDEADGFNCSYRLVALYVQQKKEELRLKRTDGYLPLEHRPGEVQADFGTADFYENGKLYHEAIYKKWGIGLEGLHRLETIYLVCLDKTEIISKVNEEQRELLQKIQVVLEMC